MAASSSSSTSEQQYSLRWNDFQSSILSSFRHLRDEEDFVDVTLACDNGSFTAHKVVLSACSPYFRRLLKANPCQHPIVILRDVPSSDMESLLRFMYHGEVHVGQEQLPTFLKTAQMLQVRGLADVNSGASGSKLPQSTPSRENDIASPAPRRPPWHDGGRVTHDREAHSPPEKRSRSYSPVPIDHNGKGDLQESLLGQALEGGPTILTPSINIQSQSNGDDSNSMSDDGEISNNDMTINSVKTEPNDLLNDSMEHHRNSFPASLLSLQGLMPGPSGIHAANQDSNYGQWQPSDDCGGGETGWQTTTVPGARTENNNNNKSRAGGVGCSLSKTFTDEITIQPRNRDKQQQRTTTTTSHHHHQSSSSSTSSTNQLLNSLNPMSEHLSVMQQKLQNNLQSFQVTSSAKYQHQQQSCDPFHDFSSITGKPKCPECGKIYSNNSNLKQHIVNVHTVQTQYLSCHICNKQFKTKQYLQIHLLSMHNIRKRKKYPVYQVTPAQLNQRQSAQMNLIQQFGSVEAWSGDDKN